MLEVGFIGRSNVGKSSLINCLLLRKLARTSSSPGATKTINLYKAEYEYRGKKSVMIISDFPGFGYTRISKSIYEGWERMIDSYVQNNPLLKRLIWVFDVRRNFDELDSLALSWLNLRNIPFSFAVNKIDKVSKSELAIRRREFEKLLGTVPVFFVSAKDRTGRKELLYHIGDVISRPS